MENSWNVFTERDEKSTAKNVFLFLMDTRPASCLTTSNFVYKTILSSYVFLLTRVKGYSAAIMHMQRAQIFQNKRKFAGSDFCLWRPANVFTWSITFTTVQREDKRQSRRSTDFCCVCRSLWNDQKENWFFCSCCGNWACESCFAISYCANCNNCALMHGSNNHIYRTEYSIHEFESESWLTSSILCSHE